MSKILVNVLTTYSSPNSLGLIYPFLANREFFAHKGVRFRFSDSIDGKISACDVVFINSKIFREWFPKREGRLYETLAGLKKRVSKVIWFDTTDSTGTTQFSVMPFVDGYYKAQVLKDRSLYGKVFYGHRIFSDYYKDLFAIEDGVKHHGPARRRPAADYTLAEKDACKLGVSWNSAMNEWGTYNYLYGSLIARLRARLPVKTDYSIRFTSADGPRRMGVSGRIGLSHLRNTIRRQREEITSMLKDEFGVECGKMPRGRYLKELRRSRIGVSPFGLGEISCRDFEIIINGALLFKQDMSHLETWPPLYREDETYIPFSWDLKDFKDRLRGLLDDGRRVSEISRRAQERYRYYLYGPGRSEIRDKILRIING